MGRPPKKKRHVSQPREPLATNRPSKRKTWTNEQMLAALKYVQDGLSTSIREAARVHGVPSSTLRDRVSGRVIHGRNPGPAPYLNKEEEDELESYLLNAAEIGYGKTRKQVISIAESVANEKGTLRTDKATHGWWNRYRKRHPNLSLRSGDATAQVRMNAITQENLKNYYKLLKETLDEHDFLSHPERIYNMDETGVPIEPRPPKIVARKGRKKIRYRTTGNKSQTTIIGCASATGHAMPPFVIFNAKQLNPLWTRNEIPGTRYGLSSSGWTDQELFHGWLKDHFLTHAVAARPLLLLVDGHSSHYSPETIRFAKEQGVIIFCLPPHTTHEAQPLDVSFFKALKSHWRDTCHSFYQQFPGKAITKFNFMELFSKAWMLTITPTNITAGFRKAGIVPFNPNAITPLDASESSEGIGGPSNMGGKENSASVANPLVFSPEKVELFNKRYEEGYDLPDAEYLRWLQAYHPDESFEDFPLFSTSPVFDNAATPHSSDDSQHWPPSCSGTPPQLSSTPSRTCLFPHNQQHPTAPSLLHSSFCSHSQLQATPPGPPFTWPQTSPTDNPSFHLNSSWPYSQQQVNLLHHPDQPSTSDFSPPKDSRTSPLMPISPMTTSSQNVETEPDNTIANLSNSSILSSSPASTSILSKHLQPLPQPQQSKPPKTGAARVLTSTECLEALEEKRRKRAELEQEKEARKVERERKRKEREQEAKKKKEERKKKEELAKKKKEEKAKEKEKRAQDRRESAMTKQGRKSSRSTRGSLTNATDTPTTTTSMLLNTPLTSVVSASSAVSEPCTSASTTAPDNLITYEESSECAFCFEPYCADGQDWIMCACKRWVHENCVEEILSDTSGQERFCPFCINI